MKRALSLVAAAAMLTACGGGGGGGRTVPTRTITMGGEVSGRLTTDDPRLTDNSLYHLYTFTGRAGQTVQIDVMSSDFDAFVILQDAGGRELARDDDTGEGLNAQLTYTLPANGMYRIIANTYREGSMGAYRLRLAAGTAGSAGMTVSVGSVIQRGVRLTGRLTNSDPRLADNSLYHHYLFNARAGESVTMDVMSSEFDAFALIQDAQGNRLASDDDSGEGLNARLTFTFPYAGTFRIVVNTYREGSSGTYTMTLR